MDLLVERIKSFSIYTLIFLEDLSVSILTYGSLGYENISICSIDSLFGGMLEGF